MINGSYANKLSHEFKVDNGTVVRLMKEHKVPVVAKVPYGKGIMTVYDREQATKVLREFVEQREKKTAPPAPAPAPVVHMVDISTLEKKVGSMLVSVGELLDQMEAIKAQNELLKKQNQEIHRIHTAQRDFLVALADQFGFKIQEAA